MSGAASYILTVITAAMAVAILRKLTGGGTAGSVMRLLGGIFMALTIISPLLKLRLPDPGEWLAPYTSEAAAAAEDGAALAEEARREIIMARTAAYIMDKAAAFDADLTVEVALDARLMPVGVTMTGEASTAVRDALTTIITESLDLRKEAVIWISEE